MKPKRMYLAEKIVNLGLFGDPNFEGLKIEKMPEKKRK